MVTWASGHVEPSLQSLTRLANLARRAGDAILEHYALDGAGAVATSKADGSPLTLADQAAHRVIRDGLEDWDPSVPFLSEEGEQPPHEERRHWRQYWLVDPLDGTKEFIQRNGEFTVNIALIEDGEPVMGVVYAPALDVMYLAAKGLGARRVDATGTVEYISHVPPAPDQPLVVVESRSHGSPELEAYLATIAVRERIRVGSSLKFCWVAEGRADIYPRLGPTMEWDVAAGDCIYRNSAPSGQYSSPLTYNKADLRNPSFVLGGADRTATIMAD